MYIVLIGTMSSMKEFRICKDQKSIEEYLKSSEVLEELDNHCETYVSWSHLGMGMFPGTFPNEIQGLIESKGEQFSGDNGNWQIIILELEDVMKTHPIFDPESLF